MDELKLPWTAEFSEYGGYDCMTAAWLIKDSSGYIVADLDCLAKGNRNDPKVQARAEFIVNAVNECLAKKAGGAGG